MTSDLNLVPARGPSVAPGAAAPAASSGAAPAGGTFASLVDNASAGSKAGANDVDQDAGAQKDPHAVDGTNPDANGNQGAVADPLVHPEWWLFGSAACQSSSGAADRNEAAVDGDKKADDEDAESTEVPVEGILNINWLLAQPASRVQRNLSADGGAGSTGTDASGAGSLKGVNQPFARTWNLVASLESKAAAAQGETKAGDSSVGQSDLGATVDALVAKTAPEVPADAAKEAAHTQLVKGVAGQVASASARSKSAAAKIDVDARIADMIAAQQRAAAPATQGTTSTALPADASSAIAKTAGAPTGRLEQTAARLAKVIERSGGAMFETAASAATTVPSLETPGGTTQDGSSAFLSHSHDHSSAAPEPVRVGGTTTPVFVVPQAVPTTIAGMPSLAATQAAAPGAPVRDADMLQQFVQTMRVQFRDGIGDAVLRLRPEHLGEVSISLRVENGSVAATVNADTAAVRQWLESNQASLRQSLSEQGLHLDRFVVQRDPEERQSREEQPSRQQQQRRRRNANADTPRFEITV